jgi:hypothetical protein
MDPIELHVLLKHSKSVYIGFVLLLKYFKSVYIGFVQIVQ